MDTQPEILDFVKAMSDADRLRIIGTLTQSSATAMEVAAELQISFRDALHHLSFLEYVGVVRRVEEKFELDAKALESLSKRQFAGERETYTPAPDLNPQIRKVLSAHLNADGSIKQIPLQPAKLRIILDYLLAAFEPGVNYTEKEVNEILRRFNENTAGLRRDLIDAGLLARESNGSRYWRVDHGK